ncbi:NAD-dependent succinate-semialdehyde dehydrogenase [Nocardioides endophyticus]|uniref:NAD-dependent succinate-semialdehyde dehydrogenase n=1 Tax=Nocardioides endophyticus TaxID=1353775 RepID=A0ABP8Z0T1_9ACTN
MTHHPSAAELAQSYLTHVPKGLWINGASRDASAGATFDVEDPATQLPIAQVADAGPQDASRALDSAVQASREWASTSARDRSTVLMNAHRLVLERRSELAALMSLELGRALPDSYAELAYGAEFLRWFAEEAVRISGRFMESPGGSGRILVAKEPVGPCLAITPWNFPLAMGTRKIAPALAAGNTIIVKPAAETPLTMLALAALLSEAGLPPGALAIVPTTRPAEVVSALMQDDRLRKVSFTGSTPVGREILRQAASTVLRTSMELGGCAPFIVFDDADLDQAVVGALAAKLRNGGQACTAANRFLVHERVADEFVEKFSKGLDLLRLGPGCDDGVTLGPLVSRGQQAKVAQIVDSALAEGAQLRMGGHLLEGPGYFFPPTLIDRVPLDAQCTREEVFGPVALVSRFTDEADALAAANATEYGLAAYFFSTDHERCMRVAGNLQAGMVGVNRGIISDVAAPFGGIKQSGLGREGGAEGIEEYLATKYVALT